MWPVAAPGTEVGAGDIIAFVQMDRRAGTVAHPTRLDPFARSVSAWVEGSMGLSETPAVG